MARPNRQKIKLLKIIEMLRQEADMDHPLKTLEICKKLNDMEISCDRRTVTQDMALLNEEGYVVVSKQIGHEKGYYLDEEPRGLSVPELKIIIDALQAANFVTEAKTDELVEKVARLGGTRKRDILESNIVHFNNRKHSNEEIYENVETLERAIQKKQQAAFYYFKLNENGERVYQKDKKRYVVEPIALIFNEDNYYLMTWNSKYGAGTTYRVDRMDDISIEEEPITEQALMKDAEIAEYTGQVFKMYGGEPWDVTIEFKDALIGPVQDKFGEDVNIIRTGPDRCVASVKVQVSPTFWGWMFQFAGMMKILSPQSLVDNYQEIAGVAGEIIEE